MVFKFILFSIVVMQTQLALAGREDFCKELKNVFNPDDVFYTTEQGVNNLKEVLTKWSKTYPKLNHTINRDHDLLN